VRIIEDLDIMKSTIPKNIKLILGEVKKKLKEIYGNNLKDIILHGSYARGDFTEGSDIDIIILLENMEDFSTEYEKFSNPIWELDLKYDTVISIISFKKEEYETRRLPLILNAKREGISV
jgi:predicted nucleotidyltransferase